MRRPTHGRTRDGRSRRVRILGSDEAPEVVEVLSEDVPHIHLNMVGVRRAARGEGLGRRLIERVQRLSADDPVSEGVTLTTEEEANVALYEHLGYEVTGRETVAPELTRWSFFRADPWRLKPCPGGDRGCVGAPGGRRRRRRAGTEAGR